METTLIDIMKNYLERDGNGSESMNSYTLNYKVAETKTHVEFSLIRLEELDEDDDSTLLLHVKDLTKAHKYHKK